MQKTKKRSKDDASLKHSSPSSVKKQTSKKSKKEVEETPVGSTITTTIESVSDITFDLISKIGSELKNKEKELIEANLEEIKEQFLSRTKNALEELIKYRNELVSKKKKTLKKQYKEDMMKIPGYSLEKCCACSRAESSVDLYTSSCKHRICYTCIRKLEYRAGSKFVCHECPVCREIIKRIIPSFFEYKRNMTNDSMEPYHPFLGLNTRGLTMMPQSPISETDSDYEEYNEMYGPDEVCMCSSDDEFECFH